MNPSVVLKASREKSLLRRHPWVFEGAIEKVIGKPHSGATVDILDAKGAWLAKGAFSPESQIRVRVWSFQQDEPIDDAFFKRKVQSALALREMWLEHTMHSALFNADNTSHDTKGSTAITNAYRLVAGESDGLPGITIDKYDNVLVMQVVSAGGEKHKKKLINALTSLFPDHVIHERSDVEVRKKEGLDLVVQTHVGDLPDAVIIYEHGVKIEVDLIAGHKTGFYLDQRKNRQIAGSFCAGKRVLNCFSYTGTFALYALAGGAEEVINADVSQSALDTSAKNLALNFNTEQQAKVKHVKEDVFELLRRYKEKGERFDVIVMDPPKFVENKRHLERAARGYKDINRIACELLSDNGVLLTFSCSGLVSQDLFNKIVADAALDANTQLSYIQKLEQDSDHVIASSFPEGAYLKGLVCVKRQA
ncbi:class I SAM-dependent rRNA methyltransferase [Glaciecola siphonariae]|uniref:Class I SAM-dependent rRNA methyltransferase n=1 Tax=Glaciecola siphonariae TaxID=521012 RepID=A0ABV9LU05_9ALTE